MKKLSILSAGITITLAFIFINFTGCQDDQTSSVLTPGSAASTKSAKTQSIYPNDRFYTESHEWIKVGEDSTALVGITEYSAAVLGVAEGSSEEEDIFITLPRKKKIAKITGTESNTKVYMPVSGVIDGYNPAAKSNPSLITSYPYSLGWIAKLSKISYSDLALLMNAGEYESYVRQQPNYNSLFKK